MSRWIRETDAPRPRASVSFSVTFLAVYLGMLAALATTYLVAKHVVEQRLEAAGRSLDDGTFGESIRRRLQELNK